MLYILGMEEIKFEEINENKDSAFKKKVILGFSAAALIALLILAFINYSKSFTRLENAVPATEEQIELLNTSLDSFYTAERYPGCRKLQYTVKPVELGVWSHSAILIDASSGYVLYEKNPDALIPPASITKLFVMYVVLDEIKKGNLKLDDVIPLPERSWAKNLPSDASRMGLGQGHIVTLKDLMLGLSVNSGNDAAIAIASCVSGSTEAFVQRMNDECKKLGLTNTHFVEPSGYSELNVTTAREMASFCRAYIDIFPQGLEMFHSVPSFSYPKRENLPDWPEYKNTLPYTKHNTNTLIGKLDGCDGIKTGYIDESGYNIALTCIRNGQRFISVTLGGPGRSTAEGNYTREHDGEIMMEWAFESFADYIPAEHVNQSYAVAVPGSSDGKYAYLVPAWTTPVVVPHVTGATARDATTQVTASVSYPQYIFGGVEAGKEYGYIEYRLGESLLEKVPLVADRTMKKASLPGIILDKLALLFF